MAFVGESLPLGPAHRKPPMLYVSLLIEALRARPVAMFWFAALSQAFVWTFVPTVFYSAPPGDVPLVLAVGREWQLGSPYGPPLAYWFAEIFFDLFGQSQFGLYLLSQLCIVVTYWAIFTLGRAIVGTTHAVMAVLLMVGVVSFSVPTPEFGPSVLAMPLTALSLLHYWRAVGEEKRGEWFVVALYVGLLLLTTYLGLLLAMLLVIFTGATARGRMTLGSMDPWAAALVAILFLFPHLVWLEWIGILAWPGMSDLPDLRLAEGRYAALLRLSLWLVTAHAGLFILLFVAGGLRFGPRPPAPAFERSPVDPFARTFIYFFALSPAAAALVVAVVTDRMIDVGGAGPLVVLSALAVIIAAGDRIVLYRQTSLGLAWLALLLIPAGVIAASTLTLAWLGVDLAVGRPAAALGQFFTDSFRRRTNLPLDIVVGDLRIGGLVALGSPDRPRLYIDASPERAPWLNDNEVRRRGAILVWPAVDPTGAPPPELRARFPEIVPEVPRTFPRAIQGRLPLLRVGWALIRPPIN